MTDEVYILGVGRNTITVIDLVEDCGLSISGLLHYNQDRTGEIYYNYPIIGCYKDYLTQEDLSGISFVLSMGDLSIRRDIYECIRSKNGNIPTLIHPSCIISRHCTIGKGVQILPGSIVQGDSTIGDNTVITVNSVIAHSAKVGSHCLISGNVMIGAYWEIGDETHIGQSSVVVSGKVGKVGKNCVLGAGAVLIDDMPDGTIYVGNPAHKLK